MALFTDGPPATIDDLRRYDSSAESLAYEAGINLDNKLAVAAEEVGQSIFSFLLFHSTPCYPAVGLSLNAASGEAHRQRLGLSDVMVTPAVIRWTALKALSCLYRDAYESDVTDRYRVKWQEFERLASAAEDFTFTTGVGLSSSPVPKAALPTVTQASQTETGVDSVIQVTWVNGQGAEGAPSDVWNAPLAGGDQITVSSAPPAGVTGWNIYIALAGNTPLLQNATPMAPGAGWSMPLGSLSQGRPITVGQPPDYIVVERRILPRG
uniref:Uncharacterized protein n=1 Tax=uncultured bacterium CSLF43 TaxID=1091575 RepID=G4WW24_9BACT|nr:hypothetical protein [uncultured bacterium CSLF43]